MVIFKISSVNEWGMNFSVKQLYRKHVLLLCAVLVVVLTVLLSIFSMIEQRQSVQRELQTQANMMADELLGQPSIRTEDLKRKLMHLTVNPALAMACVLENNASTKLAVRGSAYDSSSQNPVLCNNKSLIGTQGSYVVARAILTNEDLPTPIGELVLIAKGPSLGKLVLRWLLISLVLSGFLGGICWIVGVRFERILLKPIRQIATTAQRVTMYKDYSLRVIAGALTVVPSEIELLTDSFNAMLHEIEDRDGRLSRKSEELEKSRFTAVAANQAKSQFLANVSHELRTPLNAILGFSTMLVNEQFGPIGSTKYKEYASDIYDSGKHLLDVINDILDITKAETGSLKITIESLSLPKIIEKALNIVSGQAHERKIDIYTDLPAKLPKLYADRVRVIQILLNLLSNAIKFSNEGGKVTVKAHVESGKNGIYYFTIEVVDHGIGMSSADITKAFATFNQSDSGLNRKYEGAGLGLPLTKKLVELHHGKIKIQSTPGEGTAVTVRLTSDPALLA